MMGNHVPSAELREIGSIERLRSMLDEEVDDELADWGHKVKLACSMQYHVACSV